MVHSGGEGQGEGGQGGGRGRGRGGEGSLLGEGYSPVGWDPVGEGGRGTRGGGGFAVVGAGGQCFLMEVNETETGQRTETMDSPVKRIYRAVVEPCGQKKKTTRAKSCCSTSTATVMFSWNSKTQVLKRNRDTPCEHNDKGSDPTDNQSKDKENEQTKH